ncbi:MAG: PilW family protein [Aquabacterium sp.]|jgi:type IV pilus assembly protein PilW|uniref:PilW family protein n=1 Tax=Aquabacterium sp. TaxID=1872578 RepID=UPI002A371BB3|nr:PilW family protein [Aquabacterium sp.]MDX9844124.1 PilW family protein [Aquabacterium sp.]
MTAFRLPPPYHARQSGFTLVELMVAVLLGLLTVLVISQVLVQSEARRRTISSGSDAQLNGALALFTLQRDIQMAGYGTAANPGSMGCKLQGRFGTSGTPFDLALAPVVIVNGLSGAPDTLTVLHARPRAIAVPIQVKENHPQDGTAFIVDSSLSVAVNDLMIAIPETVTDYATSVCSLFQVTSDDTDPLTTLSATRIPHTTTGSSWNQSSVFPPGTPGGFAAKSYLVNMGNMSLKTYAISASHNLTTTERSWTTGALSTQDLFPQIVNMQALYGKDTDGNGVVDTYDETTPTTPAGWQQVMTIRVAIVARSIKDEGSNVTTSQPLWDVGADDTITGPTTSDCHGTSKCITLTVNTLPNWQRFRYKVYDTVIPLRNVLWNS